MKIKGLEGGQKNSGGKRKTGNRMATSKGTLSEQCGTLSEHEDRQVNEAGQVSRIPVQQEGQVSRTPGTVGMAGRQDTKYRLKGRSVGHLVQERESRSGGHPCNR